MTTMPTARMRGPNSFVPLQHMTIAPPRPKFSVTLFGRSPGEEFDWSLKHLQRPGDEETEQGNELGARLAEIARRYNVTEFYAPSPTDFNGTIVPPAAFTVTIPLPNGVRLHRGVKADGVADLPRTSSFLLSTGGCPVIVASRHDRVAAAHAGLRCLTRWDDPTHVSVVSNMATCFSASRNPADAWIFWSIRQDRYAHSLTDPAHAEASQRIVKHLQEKEYGIAVSAAGNIDLPTIIRMQLRKNHFSYRNAGQLTYLPPGGYDTRSQPPFNQFRNLIVVARI